MPLCTVEMVGPSASNPLVAERLAAILSSVGTPTSDMPWKDGVLRCLDKIREARTAIIPIAIVLQAPGPTQCASLSGRANRCLHLPILLLAL